MRKLFVLLGTFVFFACAGCSEDPNDQIISATIQIANGTTADINIMAKTLSDAVAVAKSDKKPLDPVKIKEAITQAEGLKTKAKALQDNRARSENRRDQITEKQREEYAAKHKSSLATAIADLDTAQKTLDMALRDAEAAADNEGKVLLESLRKASRKRMMNSRY